MATFVPLPSVSGLPKVVVFHREHPHEPVLVMQVPTGNSEEEFQTYRLRMDDSDHKRWLSRLPGARDLMYKLGFEPHLAYFPHDEGMCLPLNDVDEPSMLQKAISHMRTSVAPERVSAQFKRRQTAVPGVSRLRLAISSRAAHGGRI